MAAQDILGEIASGGSALPRPAFVFLASPKSTCEARAMRARSAMFRNTFSYEAKASILPNGGISRNSLVTGLLSARATSNAASSISLSRSPISALVGCWSAMTPATTRPGAKSRRYLVSQGGASGPATKFATSVITRGVSGANSETASRFSGKGESVEPRVKLFRRALVYQSWRYQQSKCSLAKQEQPNCLIHDMRLDFPHLTEIFAVPANIFPVRNSAILDLFY